MPTVRCPGCRRALHLPEDREVATAQCPLCGTTFDAPAAPVRTVPVSPTPAPVPVRPIPPAPAGPPAAPPRSPPERDEQLSPQEVADRRAVQSAVSWLKTATTLALVHSLSCGCFDNVLLEAFGRPGVPPRHMWLFWLGRLLAILFVYSAAESLSRRRSRAHVTAGAVVTLLLGGYLLLRAAVPTLFFPAKDDPGAVVCLALAAALVGLTNVAAGARTFLVLNRPGVRTLFAR
jgi:hypothetical protein